MPKMLFPDFLVNDEQYDASEAFWNSLFTEVVSGPNERHEWASWRPRAYANGVPFERDGNPIFDVLHRRLGKAVQVIQWPAETDAVEISAWISELQSEELLPVNELTINLSLSEESAELSKQLLKKWVAESITPDEMKRFIPELLRSP